MVDHQGRLEARQTKELTRYDLLREAGFISSKAIDMGGFSASFKGVLRGAGKNPDDEGFAGPLREELLKLAGLVLTEKQTGFNLSDLIEVVVDGIFTQFQLTAKGYADKLRDAYDVLSAKGPQI